MSEATPIPQAAFCKRCGYALRGLHRDLCPECGSPFDRRDAASYDLGAGATRQRVWTGRLTRLAVVALGVLAVCPQGVPHGSIQFKCQPCGTTILVERWELRPPPWIPFRYPGTSRTRSTPPASGSTPCPTHRYDISAAFDLRIGRATATHRYQPDEPITLNGRSAAPDTGESVLAALMHPSTIGIGP